MSNPNKVVKNTVKLQKLAGGLREHLEMFNRAVAERVSEKAKNKFNTGPDGRTYMHGNVMHVASSPGNPPNSDTGQLRASIHVERISEFEQIVADGVDYGIHLEKGTPNIDKRPFIAPAVEDVKKEIPAAAKEYGLIVRLVK